jgi:hypothetical protein
VKLTKRLLCCICGEGNTDGPDYVELEVVSVDGARQFFGAHADHLTAVMAPGITVEVHLMSESAMKAMDENAPAEDGGPKP